MTLSTNNKYINIINNIRTSIVKKIEEGALLGESDIKNIAKNYDGNLILLLNYNIKYKYKYLPILSYKIENETLVSFKSISEINSELKKIHAAYDNNLELTSSKHYEIYTDKLLTNKNNVHIIGSTLDIYYENSIIKLNIDKDSLTRLHSKIANEIDSDVDYKSIPDVINSNLELDSIIARVNNKEIALETNNLYKDIAKELRDILSSGCKISEFREKVDDPRRPLNHEDEISIPFPLPSALRQAKKSRLSRYRGLVAPAWVAILDSIHSAKPQFFEINEDNGQVLQFITFPLVRHTLLNFKKPISPRHLLVVKSKNGFRKYEIDSIQLIIDKYIQDKTLSNPLEVLVLSRNMIQKLSSKNHDENEISYTYLKNLFKKYCDFICDQVVVTTLAHSMTVRLYNNGTKSLELISFSRSKKEGEYDNKIQEFINVSEKRYTSLNAFVFTQANSNFDIAYLPNISKIPDDLRKLKFNKTLNVRKHTLSEICLPLKYKSIPIGTVNIESPISRAFNDDHVRDYIKSLRDDIQEAYEKTIGYNDIQSLCTQIINHAAVHELDQYIKFKIFNEEQSELLKSLFQLRNIENKLETDINSAILEWVNRSYPNQTDNTRKKICNLVQIKSINQHAINAKLWNGLQFIIKNLIQNIVSHGSLDVNDGNCIIIDDRPLYGVGNNEILRITCKQSTIRDEDILDKVCIAPIKKNNEIRFGMLLIGMITKTLGGHILIDRSITANFTEIIIKLPYSTDTINVE